MALSGIPVTESERLSELKDAVARRDSCLTQLDEIAARMHDSVHSDHWAAGKHDAQMVKYKHLTAQHDLAERQLKRAEQEVDRLEGLRMRQPSDPEPSAFARWLCGRDLGSDETRMHIATDDHVQAGKAEKAGSFLFSLPAGHQRPGYGTPVMATRSDIDTGTDAAGYANPERVRPALVERLAYYGSIEPFANTFVTDTGGDFIIPGMDSTAEEGAALDQDDTVAVDNMPSLTQVVMKAYGRTSGEMQIRREAITDLAFNVEDRAVRDGRRRLSRGFNGWFVQGDGNGKPQGFLKNIKDTAASGNPKGNSIKYADLMAIIELIDPGYLYGESEGFPDEEQGTVGWVLHNSALIALRKEVDGDDRPIWVPGISGAWGLTGGAPNMILGWPYLINQKMDAIGAGAGFDGTTGRRSIAGGNWGYFGVRTVNAVEIRRFEDSRTALRNAVSYIGYARRDARVMGALDGNNRCEALVSLLSEI